MNLHYVTSYLGKGNSQDYARSLLIFEKFVLSFIEISLVIEMDTKNLPAPTVSHLLKLLTFSINLTAQVVDLYMHLDWVIQIGK